MSETQQHDSHPTVNRFVENHGADRYNETNAAIQGENPTGYIDPSECVTLFGSEIRIHPDSTDSPYGIDVTTLEPPQSVTESGLSDDKDGYVFESVEGSEHAIATEYVEMVADVYDCEIQTVLDNSKVKVEWHDFPVLFEHPNDDVRMLVAPFIRS